MVGRHVAVKPRRKHTGRLAAAVVIGPVLMLSMGTAVQAAELAPNTNDTISTKVATTLPGTFNLTDTEANPAVPLDEMEPSVDPSEPGVDQPVDPPVDPPVEPPVDPPVDPPVEPPVDPPVEPPVDPPVEPPVDPPVDPPVEPPVAPPVEPTTPPVVVPPVIPLPELPAESAYPSVHEYVPVDSGAGAVETAWVPVDQGQVVASVQTGTAQQLAYTGSEQAPLMAVGAGLLLAGTGALFATRRGHGRRRAS